MVEEWGRGPWHDGWDEGGTLVSQNNLYKGRKKQKKLEFVEGLGGKSKIYHAKKESAGEVQK